jgi:sec-independent protein translocase protein TatA
MYAMALGYQELLIILVIIMVLFGGSRLPQLAKALGQSKRAFKDGQDEADEEERVRLEERRRARLKGAETARIEDEALPSEKYTADKTRRS